MRRSTLVMLLLVASALATSGAELARLVRTAWELSGVPYEERRVSLEPRFYPSVERLRRELPETATVAVLMRASRDVDRAAFVNYYLYPRRTKYFYSLVDLRLDPQRAAYQKVVVVDLEHGEAARLASYAELRAEEVGREPMFVSSKALTSGRTLIVPLVGSVDGFPPDTFRTEAIISGKDVVVTLEPAGRTRRISGQLVTSDIVGELFGASGMGWLRIESSQEARSELWLVNRGRRVGVRLPIFTSPPALPRRLAGSGTLWVVNTTDRPADVSISSRSVRLQAHAITSFPALSDSVVDGPSGVMALVSRKTADGNTELTW